MQEGAGPLLERPEREGLATGDTQGDRHQENSCGNGKGRSWETREGAVEWPLGPS